ncbi:MAG: MBL fold metallo-hydrolase, partial [Defluviitaleaceae bacterium]|nr:MBL fold metallo-hydrolase [Defluviitaleaceae bacterium]
MIDVALVGTGGMMPLPNRFLASMQTRIDGRLFLFDCGEGTQVSLKLLGWGFKNIDAILFTHYHADHISGLPGLLLAIGNAGREEALRLYGPPGLEYVVKSLCVIAPDLPFEIV